VSGPPSRCCWRRISWGTSPSRARATSPDRRRAFILLKHVTIHAILAYVLVGAWSAWPIPLVVFLAHAVIDAVKARTSGGARAFVVDQLAHLAVLMALAMWITEAPALAGGGWLDRLGVAYARAMVWVAGVLATVQAGAYYVAALVRPYLAELERELENGSSTFRPERGLASAGMVIGRLERLIVFILIMVGQPAGIGFLVAAKSIFRFGELRNTSNRMESEYIIIGTLASFAYAMAVTYSTRLLLRVVG